MKNENENQVFLSRQFYASLNKCCSTLDWIDTFWVRQHTSAYVSIRQHTSAYVSIRQLFHSGLDRHICDGLCRLACLAPTLVSVSLSRADDTCDVARSRVPINPLLVPLARPLDGCGSIRQHTSAYVSIRQHSSGGLWRDSLKQTKNKFKRRAIYIYIYIYISFSV
jgi:hypothetical protein